MKLCTRIYAPALVFAGLAVGLLASLGQSEDKVATKIELADGKFVMVAPASWESVPPKSNMITHEFRAPKEMKEEAARITVMPASGGVDANVDRWVGQFDGVKKSDAKIDKKEVSGTTVHIVDISGTFNDSMGGPMMKGPVKKRENYRMLGAIVETKASGTIFVKMTGDQKTVEPLVEDFKKMLMELTSK